MKVKDIVEKIDDSYFEVKFEEGKMPAYRQLTIEEVKEIIE